MNNFQMNESKPFSNGTEYEIFLDNYCHRCQHYIVRADGFPEFPDKGGCPILDAMENARFDRSLFPSKDIVEVRHLDGKIITWHRCTKYEWHDDEHAAFFNDME